MLPYNTNAFALSPPSSYLYPAPPLQVLLDIGAGMGMFSLAAAARGHKAYAFELSPKSLASLEASIEFNGFQHLITVQKVGQLLPGAAGPRHRCCSELPCMLLWQAPACRQWSSPLVCLLRRAGRLRSCPDQGSDSGFAKVA